MILLLVTRMVFASRGHKHHTLQSVNGPLFKLLKRDLRRWRNVIEVQAMGIFLLFICRRSKLLLLVIEVRPSFGVNPMDRLSDHDGNINNSEKSCDIVCLLESI